MLAYNTIMNKDYKYSEIEVVELESEDNSLEPSSVLLDAYALIPLETNDSDAYDFKNNVMGP